MEKDLKKLALELLEENSGDNVSAMIIMYKTGHDDRWIKYDFNVIESRPIKTGKYFVHRKDGKVHWETWNGSGFAYNANVITHWMEIVPPNTK